MASGSSDERRLVRRMCAGDEEAFDHFATTYVPGLYRFAATRLTRGLHEVRDQVELDAAATAGAVVAAIAEAPEAEDRLLRLESAELVHAALDAVPERYARALEWKYLEGGSVAEIAARLGVTEKAAESLLGRARAAFRDAYMHLDGLPAAAFAAAAPAGAETAS